MDRRIQAIIAELPASLSAHTSIADLARSVNLSRWRFCHLFKRETSQAPSYYVGTLRMREAQRMLWDTFLSVKEIRAKLGNMDRSHFNREFKKFCGLTPSEFRRRQKILLPNPEMSRSTLPLDYK